MLRTEIDEVLRDPTTGRAAGIRVGKQACPLIFSRTPTVVNTYIGYKLYSV